ncbi:type II secretion system protein GspL [Pseudomonas sp. PSKL.D1]|uniref:type II secretion system protein GspL n=1 Tax=Pseudomonas sp. PSKL.D1 TaxID=3029060 RepID=UPI0023812073|nr:type II secretion system protein GspL [Pseudomonas sp. PSKL.D1]WDY58364.1 type II secretion system protein GspL [Pseudomonas sp. PSKL.D1]
MTEHIIYLLPAGIGGAEAQWPVRVRTSGGEVYRSVLGELPLPQVGQAVVLVLPMELLSCCGTGPLSTRRPSRQTLAYAVEEQLDTALETLHLAFSADGDHVLAIDRALFERVLACLRERGIEPRAIYADADMLAQKGPAAVWLEGRWLIGGGENVRLAASAQIAQALVDRLPPMHWMAEPDYAGDPLCNRRVGDALAELCHKPAGAIDLLQGGYARRHGLFPWRHLVGALVLSGLLVSLAGQWRSDQVVRHADELRAASQQPDRQLVQAPPSSMQHLAEMSEQLVAAGGLTIALAQHTEGEGWQVNVVAHGFADLERLRERLPNLQVGQARQRGAEVRATLVWAGGQQRQVPVPPTAAWTAARLSEQAQASGLRITDLQSSEQQVIMALQGPPRVLMEWIHSLEQGGGQLHEIRLQVDGEQMLAHVALQSGQP